MGNFGHRRPDDYGWLRAKDWHAVLRDPASLEPEIKEALLAENAYTSTMMAPSEPLQAEFLARMIELEASKRAPLEIEDGGYLYYKRENAGGDHPIYARRPAAGGVEQILLDESNEARGRRTTSCIGTVRSVAPAQRCSAGLRMRPDPALSPFTCSTCRAAGCSCRASGTPMAASHFLPTVAISSGSAATTRAGLPMSIAEISPRVTMH